MLHKRPLLSLSLSLSLTVAAGFPAAFAAQPPNAQSSKPATAAPMQQVPASVPLDELRTFAEVFERIKTAYVEPIDDKTLLENAIKGMLSNLDPHSAYLEPEAFRDVTESTSGEFGGLGIEVGTEDGL